MTAARILIACALLLFAAVPVHGATITCSGTVNYTGSAQGDSLYVAVLDTTGVEDVTILDVQVYEIAASPFSQFYSLSFDNTGVAPQVLIAAFLDTDGGGLADIGGLDVFGWYDGGKTPQGISSATSQTGLDFALPTGEIHGTVTFGSGQTEARIDVSQDTNCIDEGFRPGTFVFSSGSFSVIGVYAGSYCITAEGQLNSGPVRVCNGDPNCSSPTIVNVGAGEVVNGIDLDFSAITSAGETSWGSLKSRF